MPEQTQTVVAKTVSELVNRGRGHTAAETRMAAAAHKADRMRTARGHTAAETPGGLDHEAMTNRTKQAPSLAFKAWVTRMVEMSRKGRRA